ncbi:MAG: hypothetical protein WKF75_05075 [Singulisphaera sp.]
MNFVRPGPFDQALGALGGAPPAWVAAGERRVETRQTYLVVPAPDALQVVAAGPYILRGPQAAPVYYPSQPPTPPYAPTSAACPAADVPGPTPQRRDVADTTGRDVPRPGDPTGIGIRSPLPRPATGTSPPRPTPRLP